MRRSEIQRTTKETEISVKLNIDGTGKAKIETNIGFLDHMLTLLAVHGLFDLEVLAKGDLHVDYHHTVEDIGIALGLAIAKAMEDLSGINRYGLQILPMEEALCEVAIDFCNRPYFVFKCKFPTEKIGTFDTELIEEFFRAVVVNSGITLHINVRYGKNSHHIAEAIFKAFARSLNQATKLDREIEGVPSSKGLL